MSIYDTLNPNQKEAVLTTDGPLLLLAGAGSGKTRVLTHRIAYLIEECGVNPWNILAITFTNKAAGEMRERVDQLIGMGAESIWVSTFHAACVRILRRYVDRLGYDTRFTIYDADDQKTLMKDICKHLNINTKIYKERDFLAAISHAKDECITPQEYELQVAGDYHKKKISQVYWEYERQLKANNALDFDDLLLKTVQLLQTQPDVLDYYQERFRYIMVDEYQDTNTVQFRLVSLLAKKYRNLCVVGDDDQSIYKFRGANIRNILDFEKVFEDAKVIKLEQNYRSTGNILQAANEVIKNNAGRKAKTLWTDNEQGEPIIVRKMENEYEEAEFVVSDIRKHVQNGERTYQDHAILYRTNAQSRVLEEQLVSRNIPYKIIGGINFYARREIKDMLAYLRTLENGQDDLAVKRIINVPKRGIGLATISRVQDYAMDHEISFYEALKTPDLIPGVGRAMGKLTSFMALMEHLHDKTSTMLVSELLTEIIGMTEYDTYLQEEDKDKAEERRENLDELINKAVAYEESCEDEPPTLGGFLEEVALVADVDSMEEDSDYVVLMTLHSAKGLEYPEVYMVGMEDGLFPSYLSIVSDDPLEIEEERRLCYVGITRARENLTMTCAGRRFLRGEAHYNKPSRFLQEVPKELFAEPVRTSKKDLEVPKQMAYAQAKQAFKSKVYDTYKPAQQFKVKDGNGPGYDVGDRVLHGMFGEGTVLNIVEGGKDYEVTVQFDTMGIKKMFAHFAKLQKL